MTLLICVIKRSGQLKEGLWTGGVFLILILFSAENFISKLLEDEPQGIFTTEK